jgi:hypothetical protein
MRVFIKSKNIYDLQYEKLYSIRSGKDESELFGFVEIVFSF